MWGLPMDVRLLQNAAGASVECTWVTWMHCLPDDFVDVQSGQTQLLCGTTDELDQRPCCMSICKRFNEVEMQSTVVQSSLTPVFAMEAHHWSEGLHRFLKKCADVENVDARYTLGMIITEEMEMGLL